MSFTKHKKKCLRESFTGQNHSQLKRLTEKVWKLQIKFREFDCLTGHSVVFLLLEMNLIFMLFETSFVFMLFALMLFGT